MEFFQEAGAAMKCKKKIFCILLSVMFGCGGSGGGGTADTTTPLTLTLVKKVTITTDAASGSARPEIVATANRVFVIYRGIAR